MKISKVINLIVVAVFMLLITGCVKQPKPMYSYNDYSERYYQSKKDFSPETALELQKSIESSIENAPQSSTGRVAPGMYANLGYIYLKSGNNDKAIENFKKEKNVYPEAGHFMDRMIKKVEVSQGLNK